MRKLCFTYKDGLFIEEYEKPTPRKGEVLVKMKYGGLCASDIHYMEGRFQYSKSPIVPGHEGSGVIEEVGEDVEGIKKGETAIVDYVKGCKKCHHCKEGRENRCMEVKLYGFDLDGTFQEYMIVPEENVIQIPPNISLDSAAIIGCAIVTPYHAIKAVGGVKDRDVAFIGLGGVGIHGILLSRMLGAKRIIGIDIIEKKSEIAKKYGATEFINSLETNPVEKVIELTGEGVDIAFEFVGKEETIKYALKIVKKGGIAVIAGLINRDISINFSDIIVSEKKIYGIVDHTNRDLREVVQIISREGIDISQSITHRFKIVDIKEAINLLANKSELVNRILIEI